MSEKYESLMNVGERLWFWNEWEIWKLNESGWNDYYIGMNENFESCWKDFDTEMSKKFECGLKVGEKIMILDWVRNLKVKWKLLKRFWFWKEWDIWKLKLKVGMLMNILWDF